MKRDIDNTDELRLKANEEECFPLKSKLKRAETLDYEGNEFEQLCIAHTEGDNISTDEDIIKGADDFKHLRLKANLNLVMPDKDSLKKQVRISTARKLWLAVPFAAALIIAFFLIQKNDNTNTPVDITASIEHLPIEKKNNTKPLTVVQDKSDNKQSVDRKNVITQIKNEGIITPVPDKKENTLEEPELSEIEIIETLNSPSIALGKLNITEIKPDINLLAQVNTTNNNEDIEVEIIEIDLDEHSNEPKSLFGKMGTLIADWNNPDNQNKVQERIIGFNSFIGKSSTVINDYTEDGKLLSTQIDSEGLKYNKHYKTNTNVEVYVVEVSSN